MFEVSIAKQGSELVEALRKLVRSLIGLMQDVKGLNNAVAMFGQGLQLARSQALSGHLRIILVGRIPEG